MSCFIFYVFFRGGGGGGQVHNYDIYIYIYIYYNLPQNPILIFEGPTLLRSRRSRLCPFKSLGPSWAASRVLPRMEILGFRV